MESPRGKDEDTTDQKIHVITYLTYPTSLTMPTLGLFSFLVRGLYPTTPEVRNNINWVRWYKLYLL